MNRRTSFIAAAVVATIAVIGAIVVFMSEDEVPSGPPKKLVLLTQWEENPEYNKWYAEKGQEFAKKSGYEVEVMTIPYPGYDAKYLDMLSAKTGAPDMFMGMTHQWCGQHAFCDPMPSDLRRVLERNLPTFMKTIGEWKGALASDIEHAAGKVGPIKCAANRRHHVLRGRGMNKLSGRTVRPHSPPGDLRIEGTRCRSSGTVRASGPQNDPRHRVAQGVAQSTLPIEFCLFVRCPGCRRDQFSSRSPRVTVAVDAGAAAVDHERHARIPRCVSECGRQVDVDASKVFRRAVERARQMHDSGDAVEGLIEHVPVQHVTTDRADQRGAPQVRRRAARQRSNLLTIGGQRVDESTADEAAGSGNKDERRK